MVDIMQAPVMIQSLILVDWLCHQHVFVHEDDGEDFTRRISLIARCLVKGPTRVKADLPCNTSATIVSIVNAGCHALLIRKT